MYNYKTLLKEENLEDEGQNNIKTPKPQRMNYMNFNR